MSWEAVNWANEQRAGSASAQLVLLLLANVAKPSGEVDRIDADYLAQRSIQSRASVFRRLAELEKGGVLERERVASRGNGAPVVSGRLRLDRALCVESMAKDEAEEGGQSQIETEGGQSQSETEGGGQSHPCDIGSLTAETALYRTNSIINSSSAPTTLSSETAREPEADDRRKEGVAGNAAEADAGLDAAWRRFLAAYPVNAAMDLEAARAEFAALPGRARAEAIRAAGVFRGALEGQRRQHPPSAARWLREKQFERISELRQAQAVSNGLAKPQVFVAEGTAAWKAWLAARGGKKIPNYATDPEHRGRNGWWFPSLYPGGGSTGPPG